LILPAKGGIDFDLLVFHPENLAADPISALQEDHVFGRLGMNEHAGPHHEYKEAQHAGATANQSSRRSCQWWCEQRGNHGLE
jgi:hypothetical protein